MEFLKPVLGDELYAQVEADLKGNDKIKLANLADGGYVDKKKFDDMETDKKAAEGLVATRDGEIAELKKVDAPALQGDNEKLKADNAALQLGRKLDAALYTAQARNAAAVGALLDMSKISLDDKGNLVGADEQIAALKQAQSWAFGETLVPGAGGNPVPPAGGGDTKASFSDAITERMSAQTS
jgi:hypothetical protein